MPEIKDTRKRVLGPLDYTGFADPNLNNSGVSSERIGSKDTWLSFGSYDANFDPIKSQNQQRFDNQGFVNWLGNNAWSLGKGTATGVVKGAGGITSLLASPFVVASGYDFFDSFEHNPINVVADSTKKLLDEYLPSPTFVDDSFNDQSFTQSLSSPGQLVSQNIESLSFLTSTILSGGLLGKLNAGSKLVSKFSSARNLDEVLEGAKALGLSDKARKIDSILSHSILTTSEAAQEGEDLRKTIVKKLTADRVAGKNNLTDEDIEATASHRATNVFWHNMAALSVTNIPFTKLYGKTFSKVAPKTDDLAVKLGKDGFEAVKYDGIKKLVKGKEFLPTATKALAINVLSEALEESIQHTVQEINQKSKEALSMYDATKELLSAKSAVETTLGMYTDKDRAKAAGLGGLIGGASVVARMPSMYKEAKEYKQNQIDAVKELNDKFDTVLSSNIYKKTPDTKVTIESTDNPDGSRSYTRSQGITKTPITTEDFLALQQEFSLPDTGGEYTIKGNYELNDLGEPVVDNNRLSELQATATVHAELDDMFENANMFGTDNVSRTLVREEKLTELARVAFENNAGDLLIERFETALNDKDSLEKYGATADDLKKDIESLNTLKNIYENVNQDLLSTSREGDRLNRIRKIRMYQLGARANTLSRLGKESIDEVYKLRSDLLNTYKDLKIEDEALDKYISTAVNIRKYKNNLTALLENPELTESQRIEYVTEVVKKEKELKDAFDKGDFKAIEQSIRKTALEKVIGESLKLSEIVDARSELDQVYDKYLSTKDLDKIAKIEDTAFKTKSEIAPKSITLNDALTNEFFSAYIDRRATKLLHRDKRTYAQKQFIKNFLDYFLRDVTLDPTDVKSILETSGRFGKMIEALIDANYKILPESLKLIEEKLTEFISNIDPDLTVDDGEDTPVMVYVAHNLEKLDNLNALEEPTSSLMTEEESKKEAIIELSSTANTVVLDFTENPDEYDDLGSVLSEITKMTHLVRVLNELGLSSTRETALLTNLIEIVKPKVEENVINKDLKNIAQSKTYGQSFYHIMNSPGMLELLSPIIDTKGLTDLFVADPYTGYLALIQAVKQVKSPKEIEDLLVPLESSIIEEADSLVDNGKELILRNPIKFLSKALSNIDSTHPAVVSYLEDYDVIKFMKNADGDKELETLVNLFWKATALLDTKMSLHSELDSLELLNKIKQFVEDNIKGIPAPSIAQERVIMQLSHFMSSPSSGNLPHDDIAALKSPPGSGKTLIIIPALMGVLGIKKEEVLTSASQALAAENLSKAVGTSKGLTSSELVQAMDSDTISETTKMIVFDEAAAESTSQLYEVAKAFARYKLRNPDTKLKMIYLYDPNQGTGRVDGLSALEVFIDMVPSESAKEKADKGENTGIGGEFYYSYRVYDVMPLPVSYRSDVPQILSLQNRFLSKTEVPLALEASASTEVISSTKDIQGTYIGDSSTLTKTVTKSLAENPTRTRVIIVLDEVDKAKYASTGVLTITTKESAGLTFDEAYVDIPKLISEDVDEIRAYNQKVYTALSRARDFVFLAGHEGTNTIDTTIAEKVQINSAFKQSRHVESIKQKTDQITTIEALLKEKAEKTEVKEKEDEEVTVVDTKSDEVFEEEVLDEVNEDITEDVIDLPIENLDSELQKKVHVNNETLKALSKEKIDKVKLIREENNGLVGYRLIAPSTSSNPYSYYAFDLAVMDEPTARDISNTLGIDFNSIPVVREGTKSSNTVQYSKEDGAKILASTDVSIDPRSHTIKFRYNPNTITKFSKKDDVLNLVTRFITSMEEGGLPIINKDDILADLDRFVTIKYFSSQDQKKKVFPDNFQEIPTGKPLLVIQGMKTNKGNIVKPMFIELQTPKLNPDSEEFKRYNGPSLMKLSSTLKKFDEKLQALNLSGEFANYAKLRPGEPLIGSNGSPYYIYHAFIVALSDAFSSSSKDNLVIGSQNLISAFNKLNPNIALPPIPIEKLKPLLKLASEIDELVHGDRLNDDGTYRKRGNHGPAQTAMDRISSANMIVELPNMTTKILRSTRTKRNDSGKLETYVGGLTLLGPITFAIDEGKATNRNSTVGMSYNPLFPVSVLENLRNKVKMNPNFSWAKAPAIKSLLDSKESLNTVSFTLEDFGSLFSAKGFLNANSGFGIRAPLYKPLFQSSTVPVTEMDLDGVVETTFDKVYPTNLGLALGTKSTFEKTVPDQVQKTTSVVADMKADIREANLSGEKIEFTEKEKEKFEKETKVSVDEAIENYESNTIAEFIKKPNFIALMKTVFSLNSQSLKDTLRNIFEVSPKALGSKIEKAPRDFVASFSIATLLGVTKSYDYSRGIKSANVLSMVERYYSSTKRDEKTTAKFNKEFFKELEILGETVENLQERSKDLSEAAQQLIDLIGSKIVLHSIDSPLDFIRDIVLLSSEFRNFQGKEVIKVEESAMGEAVPIEVDIVQLTLNRLRGKSSTEIIEALEKIKSKDNDAASIIEYFKKQVSLDEDVSGDELIANAEVLFTKKFSSKMEFEDTNLVSEEEGEAIYNKFFNPIGINFIKKLFSSKRSEGFRIVEANRLISEFGEKVWGVYKNGVVYVASNGKVGSKVVLHESFHHVVNAYLTKGEKSKLFELGRNKYGELSNLDIEERLADDFMSYAKKEKTFGEKIKSFFRKLLRFFNFTYHNLNSIESFFESTLDGNFYPRQPSSEVTRHLEIERFFGSSEVFELAKKTILDKFEEIELYDGNGKILAFDEILGDVFKYLREEMESGEMEPSIYNAIKPLFTGTQSIKQFANYFFGNSPVIKSIQDANAEAVLGWTQELKEKEETRAIDVVNRDEFEDDDSYESALLEEELILEQRKETLRRLLTTDISAETLDHEKVDPEMKITGVVKQRLLSVKYKHRGQEIRADFSKVYNVVLNLLASSDNSSMESLINSIRERTKSILTVKSRSETPKNVRVAAALFIESQLDKYTYLAANRPKSIVFRKDINHENEYVIVSDTVDVSNLTYTTAKDMKGVQIIFYTPGTNYNTFDGFAKTLKSPYSEVKLAFEFYEQSNFIKSLVGAVTSLRRSSPTVGVKEYKEGVFTSKYIANREAGAKAVVETDIINGYIKLHARAVKNNEKSVFPEHIISGLNKKVDVDEAFSLAQSILLQFGIRGFKKDSASEAEVSEFLDKARLVISKINTITEDTAFDVISDESSFIESAVTLISSNGNLIQNSSYIRGDGQRAYLWVDSSLQTSIFTSIGNAIKGYSGMVNNYFKVEKGGALYTKSPFLKNNIFFNGVSNIFGTFEHDSIKWKGRDSNAVDLYSETPSEALSRTFDLGFLSKLASKNTYLQFLPIPSNRRTISAVEVSFLGKDKVRAAIRNIILEQKNRKNPKDDPKLSNNDNYVKNWDKFNLPGISGMSTSMSVDEAFALVMKNLESERIPAYLQFIIDNLSKEGKENKPRNFQIDMRNLSLVYKKLTGKHLNSLDVFNKNLKKINDAFEQEASVNIPNVFSGIPTKEIIAEIVSKRNEYIKEVLKEVVEEYYLNHIVNSYSLSQMIYGDESFYKSKEDLTKRIQVFTATGDVPIIDNEDGFPPTSRVGVISDVDVDLGELEDLKDDSFRETAVEGDGQGFMLPEAYERLAAARGKYAEDDITLKTVYAAVGEDGVPVLLKYAVIVLTDELIGYNTDGTPRNKVLRNLRESMRFPRDGKAPLDQAVFASAVKTGGPSSKNLANPENPTFDAKSIIEIDNRHFRFQLNPAADVDKSVVNASQLTSMIDTNGQNPQEAYEVHKRNSMLMDIGMRLASRELGVSRKGKLSKKSEKILRKRLIRSNEGMTGKESLVTMLGATQDGTRNTDHTISLDLPIIGNQLVASLASLISSATVGFRFPGSKLVLQSEYGTYTDKQYRLKYKDKDGFTEVVLPESFREFFKEGDMLTDSMMGFRIPSTNYHSGVALKVKGFYKAPQGSAGNIVIVPAAMSYFQGSDYDIDSLFVIKKESLKEDVDLSKTLSKYGIKSQLNLKAGQTIGADEALDLVNGSEFLYLAAIKIERALEDARNRGEKNLKEIEDDFKEISKYFQMAAKNEIVHIFSSNLREMRNRRDLLTPITFARVSKTKSQILSDFSSNLPSLKADLIKSGLITEEEFRLKEKDLMANGIDILRKEDLTPLAKTLLNKYSTIKEDSVIEMYAKLEASRRGISTEGMSAGQISDLVNPKGTTHDPLTQIQIHSNTYAGVSLTGIAANTAKTLAYIFNAGRIIEVTDGTKNFSFLNEEGEYDVSIMSKTLRENGFNSLNQAINSTWEIVKREDPKLKFGFKLGGTVFDSLSRFEKNLDGTYKKAFEFASDLINIFETIDTVTNLAIDNVKEQKLFVLGITNSNSNAFMAGISLGLPLNELSKIFRSPAVAKASLKNSFSATSHKKEMLKELEKMDLEQLTDLVKDYAPDSMSQFLSRVDTDKGDIKKALSTLSIELSYLDDSYLGKSNLIGDYILMNEISKLEQLGEELFDYAVLFSTLRKMPGDKSQLDSVIESALKYQEIASEQETVIGDTKISSKRDQVRQEVVSEKIEAIKESDVYIQATDAKKKELLSSIEDFPALIEAETNRRYEASLVSRLIRGSVRKNFSNKGNSIFEHLTVFSIPHIYSSWVVAKRIQYLIENTFAIHSTELKNYADNISEYLGITYGRNSIRKLVPEEFFKFITSDMILNLPYGTVDFKVNPNMIVSVSNGRDSSNLYGQDAWAHNFASNFEEFKVKYNSINPGNEFLNSVEVVTDGKGAKILKITSDKTSNPETILKIKEGYRQLLLDDKLVEGNTTIEPSAVALNLFKYSAISQGMFYSRTGFSLVFPIQFSEAYSSKLSEHMDRVFEKDELGNPDAMKTRHNLDRLKDSFTYQFMKNNPNILPYRKDFPITIGRYESRMGDLKRVYSGVENDIYFDLSYNSVDSPPKYISDFSKSCYVLIASESGKDYYRKISTKHNISLNQFPTTYNTGKLLSIDLLADKNLKGHFLPKSLLEGNIIKYPYKYKLLDVGDKVFVHDLSSSLPTVLISGVVKSVSRTDTGYNYVLDIGDGVKLTTESSPMERAKLQALFTPTKFKERNDKSLPTIGDVKGDIKLEFAKGQESVMSAIMRLESGMYNIPSNLFNDYYRLDPDGAVAAAKALRAKTKSNFDVLGVEKPKDLDNVSGEISVDISTSGDFYEILRNKANRQAFKIISEGRFYFIGIQEKTPLFAYVRKIHTDKADIDIVSADIVSAFSEAVVTAEELDNYIKTQC